ncbi:MAG: ankyrin repeat domain-containing protein [Planctomycetes bacterium]|nr:ankyrin repeat domain-containing protein [Planctomycetota bacterium]MBL7041751.1 ankyrin repeat domain-containing protein [Pirellulaceae bacterium]
MSTRISFPRPVTGCLGLANFSCSAASRLLAVAGIVAVLSYCATSAVETLASQEPGESARKSCHPRYVLTTNGSEEPLFDAIRRNDLERVRELLDRGANLNELSGSIGYTPLMWALRCGDERIVSALLQARPDMSVRNKYGDTALHVAVGFENKKQRAAIIESLLKLGANPNARAKTRSVFEGALATSCPTEVFALLISKGLDVKGGEPPGCTALHDATRYARADVVKLLLDAGADVNTQTPYGKTPLMNAASDGSIEAVRLLLTAGADIHTVDEDGRTALHHAAEEEVRLAAKVIKLLLDAGAEVDARTKEGVTPLMLAAYWNRSLETTECLVAAGADIKARDKHGRSVLSHAVSPLVSIRDILVPAFLRSHGTDVNVADKRGWTPLMHAARGSSVDVLRVLLYSDDEDVNVDARTDQGWTALLIAVGSSDPHVYARMCGQEPHEGQQEQEPVGIYIAMASAVASLGQAQRVWALLKHGADPDVRTKDGTTVDSLLEGRTDLDAQAIRALVNLARAQKKLSAKQGAASVDED